MKHTKCRKLESFGYVGKMESTGSMQNRKEKNALAEKLVGPVWMQHNIFV